MYTFSFASTSGLASSSDGQPSTPTTFSFTEPPDQPIATSSSSVSPFSFSFANDTPTTKVATSSDQVDLQGDLLFGLNLNSDGGKTLADIRPNIVSEGAILKDDTGIALPIRQYSDATPESGSWALPIMYLKTDGSARESSWQIGYNSTTNRLCSIFGKVGCKFRTEDRAVEPKGGKNYQQQAWQEAKQRYIKKWRKGHRIRGDDTPSTVKAMLAKPYKNSQLHPGESSTTSISFPALMGPKIDGIRGLVNMVNGELESRSRDGNKQTKYLQPHLDSIIDFMAYLPSGVGLDGEWYSHQDLTFQDIVKAVQSRVNRNANIDKVKYYIFDLVMMEVPTEERDRILVEAYKQYLADGGKTDRFTIVHNEIVNSHDEILALHEKYLNQGYEGGMIRQFLSSARTKTQQRYSYYRPGPNRYNNLLKVKHVDEDEFIITAVREGKGNNEGKVIFELKMADGKTFNCVPKGAHEQRVHWFNHPEECVGRLYTVHYFGLTDDGVPRHPRGKAFRDTVNKPGVKTY